jgi:transposase
MLRPHPIAPVPDDTARVARAAFPKGHPYLRLADELGNLFTDDLFTSVYPAHGQPALAPWRLALVTILQFAEDLSDRQAADAVRSRIDWKYVLRLELTDPGFDASVLSEFRARLVDGEAERLLLDTLLGWCRERDLIRARGRQRTDSTQVLAAVRALNRVELVAETMRHVLNDLAAVAPEWLRTRVQPDADWATRYIPRPGGERSPRHQAARETLALAIGHDGHTLLDAIYATDAPTWLRALPAVETLRRVWIQQYVFEQGTLRWRTSDELPPASRFISSPYDDDAHYACKFTTSWIGYKVHITETCEADLPRLITNVETTSGPIADGEATPLIHQALQARDLLPEVHVVDTGYLDAPLLVASQQEYDVDLLGPTRPDYRWQAREQTGFAAEHFQIDWDHQQATCPEGKTSLSWTPAVDKRTNAVVKIKFSSKDCRHCPSRAQCFRSASTKHARRTLTIRPQTQYQALQAARQREHTADYAATYAWRAGVEGTLSRGVRTCGLRRSRYIGQARTHLGHVMTAVALNFLRLGEWLSGRPMAKTRRSPFALLMAAGVAA